MRYLIALLLMITYSTTMQSQTYEIGVFGGAANYIGDVGNSAYFNPNTPVGGLVFKWNRSERHTFRFSVLRAKIEANDANSNEGRRQQRGLSFDNTITEASLGIEYNFWEWSLYEGNSQAVPYLYTGLTGFHADDIFRNTDGELVRRGDNINFAIPMVVGFKTTLGTNFIGAIEFGARYTFTDNLDGSDPAKSGSSNTPSTFGNNNTNDWYVFSGITLTYTFGRKPCYCTF